MNLLVTKKGKEGKRRTNTDGSGVCVSVARLKKKIPVFGFYCLSQEKIYLPFLKVADQFNILYPPPPPRSREQLCFLLQEGADHCSSQ